MIPIAHSAKRRSSIYIDCLFSDMNSKTFVGKQHEVKVEKALFLNNFTGVRIYYQVSTFSWLKIVQI